jgi:formylglycine-generating enzyme required for sulfatase activity
MNKLVSITLLLLIIAPNGNAQKHHESKDVIQNFVRVEPKLYACKFETSNADYQAFLEDIIQRRPELKYTLILDTAKWRNEKSVNKKLQKKYFNRPKYAAFPVVNISYEQANFYCNWLTQMYHLNPERPFKKVVFRLPTKQEWNRAVYGASATDSFPWAGSFKEKPKHLKINNGQVKSPYLKKVNKKQYEQGNILLYHALGNASEMVSSKGDCVGGNFASHPYFFSKDSQNEFFPAYVSCPLVGFRVFMQIMIE